MYNDKILKSVAEAVKQVMEAELSSKQKAIAKMSEPKHKIDAGDLSKLRAGHKPVKEAVVKGKGYDNPENERKAPEGKVPMTSLMPGHDERAAKFLARQAKGTLVKGKAGSAPQKEPGMKKEEVEQVDEAQSHQAKTTMKHIKNPTKGEIEASKHMKSGTAGYRDRIAMLKSAEARGGLKKEEVEIAESDDLGPVKKKQKTVMLVHKTSGREKVIVDTPENRKRHAEMGFHPIKEEASQDEFNAEIKKAQDKSQGKAKAEVAKPAVQAVKQESVEQTFTIEDIENFMQTEEYQQLDELSKNLLSRYKKAAAKDQYDAFDKDNKLGIEHQKVKRLMANTNKGAPGMRGANPISKTNAPAVHKALSKASDEIQKMRDPHQARFAKRRSGMELATKKMGIGAGSRGVVRGTGKLNKEEVEQIDERTLSSGEMEKREKYVKSMKKGLEGFKQRYGERAKEVMYATATKMAKKD
jgi:hypothetical protein